MPYIIYADIESLMEKVDKCKNNPEKSSTTKTEKHIPCGYSMPTIQVFDHIENKHSLPCWEDCVKTFRESLREHTQNITDLGKKKMLLVTKKELKLH